MTGDGVGRVEYTDDPAEVPFIRDGLVLASVAGPGRIEPDLLSACRFLAAHLHGDQAQVYRIMHEASALPLLAGLAALALEFGSAAYGDRVGAILDAVMLSPDVAGEDRLPFWGPDYPRRDRPS